ncbi:MAG TPA: serine hydrolase domain-containing protein [Acetobacteraceae bacterium]|nr:serine hydrolase domain-containing protein [Acetobacteraceae bacterium]
MTHRTDRISALLSRGTAEGSLPGVAVAAVFPDGEIVAAAAGVRDVNSGAAMHPDSIVWIASMTKAVTAAAAMQQVEQGKLSLDAPIGSVLPQLADVQVLDGFEAGGAPKLRPARAPITLRHLLTHSSGFVYDLWNADMARYLEVTGKPGIISCTNAALDLPLVFDPGAAWDYGIGIDWAGKAVEAVSGKTLGSYLVDSLFRPLGMRDTGFRISDDQRSRLALVHARTPDGVVVTDFEIPQAPEFEMGGGGLYATVSDYLRFARMILGGGVLDGTRVLAPSTVATMGQNAMGDLRCRALKSAAPGSTNDVGFLAGMQWGLSFLINPEVLPSGRSAGSLAWAGLANSYYWIDPSKKVAGVFATQLLPFFDAAAVALFGAFEAAVYEMA